MKSPQNYRLAVQTLLRRECSPSSPDREGFYLRAGVKKSNRECPTLVALFAAGPALSAVEGWGF